MPIYVNGEKHKSLSSECTVPAFCCKPVAVGASTMNLVRRMTKVDMSATAGYPYDELDLQVPGLEAHDEWEPPSMPWELTRPFIPTKTKKVKDAKDDAAKGKNKKQAGDVFLFNLTQQRGATAKADKEKLRMLKNVSHILR